jgi:hypothetical protein
MPCTSSWCRPLGDNLQAVPHAALLTCRQWYVKIAVFSSSVLCCLSESVCGIQSGYVNNFTVLTVQLISSRAYVNVTTVIIVQLISLQAYVERSVPALQFFWLNGV